MFKKIALAVSMALVPASTFAGSHVSSAASCAVHQRVQSVQVVSPQVTQYAPAAVVQQNVCNQNVVGATVSSYSATATPVVGLQVPVTTTVVQQPVTTTQTYTTTVAPVVQQPVVVQQYNAGLATFQGTQRFVNTQQVHAHANVVGAGNVYSGAVVQGLNHRAGIGARIFGGNRQRSKTVSKSFSKSVSKTR